MVALCVGVVVACWLVAVVVCCLGTMVALYVGVVVVCWLVAVVCVQD